MSNSDKTVSLKKSLVSGLWGYLLFAGIVTFVSVSAAINEYPTLPLLTLSVWLLMPIFFIRKELALTVEESQVSVVKKYILFGSSFAKEEVTLDKSTVSLEERKHLGKKYLSVTGADLEVQLYGVRGKQYECIRNLLGR